MTHALAQNGMVVTEQHLASDVGINILKSGGNAIDAAVAVGYSLAVVNPCCGNIGGGGFMTIHLANGKNIFINFRERAPLAATRNMFLDSSNVGYLAVATPGTVLGLETVLKKYGTLSREKIIAPAIQLAEKGFILQKGDIQLLKEYSNAFAKESNVASIFLKPNHQDFTVGDRLVQTDLANTLKQILAKGSDFFYKGTIAEQIVYASQTHHGILTLKDFSDYSVQELQPIQCTYRGYTIISAPPPSSGGVTLCEMLNILEGYSIKPYHSAESVRDYVEAMRYAFYDRNNLLGDPDFIKNPIDHLISKDYAKIIRKNISQKKTFNSNISIPEGMQTTHYSIIDKWGNAVSVTYTLNSFFGAKVIAGNTGFFLNDEMDDFASKPGVKNQFGLVQGENNSIAPGKRPLSSMAPTIVLKNNKVVLVIGSPGGPRIITSTLLALLNVLDYHMNIQDAVDAPRFHHQWLPNSIDIEPNVFSSATQAELIKMGYQFTNQKSWGAVEAIAIDDNSILGGSDKRRSAGKAVSY